MMGKLLPFRRPVEESLSDEALVAACGLGDAAALGTLFDRYHVPVYRFLSRYLGADRPDLDDLVQATFLEVMRSSAKFQRKSAVRTWVFGIAANLARHHIRGEVRRRAAFETVRRGVPPSSARPDDAAERQQMMARLGEALGELPHDLRTAFVMCELEEIPGVEVARVLGIREGTLWRRLHDARQRLRGALEKGRGDP